MPNETGWDQGYRALAFAPEGRTFASCGVRLQVVERASGTVVQSAGGARRSWSRCEDVSFARTRFAAILDDVLRLWDARDGRELPAPHARGDRLALSDDGGVLATWNSRIGGSLAAVGADGQIHVARVLPGQIERADALELCATDGGNCAALGGEHRGVVDVVFAPHTRTVVSVHRDGSILAWDAPNGPSSAGGR